MTTVRVHLKTWILDDGAVEPFGVGDRVELGLGIDVEQFPVVADQEDSDGVTPLPTPSSSARVSARADVVGPTHLILGADGIPFSALVTPLPDVPLVLIGRGVVDPEWNGHRSSYAATSWSNRISGVREDCSEPVSAIASAPPWWTGSKPSPESRIRAQERT